MIEEILALILKDTHSEVQLKHRIRILKSYLTKHFFGSNGTNQLPGVTPDETLSISDLNWLKSLPQDFYHKFNAENIYKIFSDIDAECVKIPVLTVYLTFEPNEAVLSQISAFIRQNFNPSLLLDIKLNPSLIAGTALAWRGVLRDYSLKAKLEEKKSEISEGFKKFLR